MAKRPEEQLAQMIADLPAKTGKSLEEWLEVIRAGGLTKHKEIRVFLMETHGVGYGYANQIALRAVHGDPAEASEEDILLMMYTGAKAPLRPIHDALMEAIAGFGDDVDLAAKKGYVSLRRTKQFAMIQPSTATRMDLGLILRGVEPEGRLEASGSWNAMFSHRVRLVGVADVDTEVIGWIQKAYDSA